MIFLAVFFLLLLVAIAIVFSIMESITKQGQSQSLHLRKKPEDKQDQ
jgi:hypothetical protein